MLKTIDGRTLTGLRRQIKGLGEIDETKHESNLLVDIENGVKLATAFHEDVYASLTPAQADKATKAILPYLEFAKWPQDIKMRRLNGVLKATKALKDFSKLLAVCEFWTGGKPDPFHPTCGNLPGLSPEARVQVYVRVIIRETLVPLVGVDTDAAVNQIMDFAKLAIPRLESVNPLDLTMETAEQMGLCSRVFRVALTGADPAIGSEYSEDFNFRY